MEPLASGDSAETPAICPQKGEVFAGRFVVERVAGRGGMGVVFRALDRVSGEPVAVKVVSSDLCDPVRFLREAQLLAELDHPAIVRYVARGETEDRKPFLAMEWLDGEDLAARLARGGLAVTEAVTLVIRIATGLAEAHARGIVHRDIKPSNVFLVGNDAARAKLLDFGIARVNFSRVTSPLTRSGVVLGTVGYMAPEQALADERIDARADIFSLGAVLFECLIGRPAFAAKQVVGLLAKVLREDAPRVREIRPELPSNLDDLVARMMSRDCSGRPRDAAEVLSALLSLGLLSGDAPSTAHRKAVLSHGEQRFVSVILATRIAESSGRLNHMARSFGGDLLRLANGTLVVIFESPSSPNAQAMRAGACALAVRDAFSTARIALVTGLTSAGRNESPAAIVDRAASLLVGPGDDAIRIDSSTAALLGNRFELVEKDETILLRRTTYEADTPRTLLGRATPFLGRAKELALLEGTWRECVDDSTARAILVVGPPGQGKSRLRHEFIGVLREREDVRAVIARADAVGAGSTFVVVRQLLRQAFGLTDDRAPEPIVRSRVTALLGEAEGASISDFLLELLELPSSLPPSPQLRAARNDPQIMANWLRRAFVEWLAAESASKPLLLVLEDLHWADLPSVMYLSDVLRGSAAKSLMVLALARPEVKDVFPNLWAGVEAQQIALGRLTAGASEKLVRAVTANQLSDDTVGRIVRRAEGNAFYLEELIRHVTEGRTDGLPDTVLAVVQSRFHELAADDRRLVRAASIFGEVFWHRGIERLLGVPDNDPGVQEAILVLVEHEVFEPVRNTRLAGEAEYTFRHSLLREAAYAMLTDDDRVAGHRLAGEWLEGVGPQDPLMLAHHFEIGQQPKRAVPWLLRAQQTAYDGGDVPAVYALAASGARCGALGDDLGVFRLNEGLAHTLLGAWPRVAEPCGEAMALLPRGSTRWFLAASMGFISAMFLGDPGASAFLLREILSVEVRAEATGPYGLAVFSTCVGLIGLGQKEIAVKFVERAWNEDADSETADPAYVLRLQTAIGFLRIAEGDLASALSWLSQATQLALSTGDVWGRACSSTQFIAALVEAGLVARVEATARDTLAFCERTGLSLFTDWTHLHLARGYCVAGRIEPAVQLARALLERPDPLLVANARALLAQLLVGSGELAEGVREATRALEEGVLFPAVQAAALAALALAELRQGRPANALVQVDKGLEAAASSAWPREHSVLRLLRAEALFAAGRFAEAREAIQHARSRIARVADSFADPEIRRCYETEIAENARINVLAVEWLTLE